MKPIALLIVLLAVGTSTPLPSQAQTPEPAPAPAAEPASQAQLDSWLSPIALYPDPLLAQVLSASTQPADVVLADRFLASGGDPNAIDAQPWNPSVKALVHYPGVLKMMSDYLPWTTALGEAYLYDEPAVVGEIQRLRAAALGWGNLESTDQENVIDEDGYVEILPTEADVIYVPEYDSDIIYTQPLGPGCITFGPRRPMGLWMDRDFDWRCRQILVWNHLYQRPADWWSSRCPRHAASRHPGHRGHSDNPVQDARTRPSHFVVWQVQHVRVVGSDGRVAGGTQQEGVHQHHIEHLASARPNSSSLVVLPNRGAAPVARSSGASSAFHVFSSSTPVHPAEMAEGHHDGAARNQGGSIHEVQRFGHQASHQAVSPSHEASSHAASAQHTPSASHASSSAHAGASNHTSSGGGRH